MKATKAVIQQRVEQVLKIRLRGAQFHDIRQYASENDPETGRPWNVSDRQIWRYVKRSDRKLARTQERDREKLLNLHLGKRRDLYAHSVEAGDWRTALAILRDEAELLGLYPSAKFHHEVKKVEEPIGITAIVAALSQIGKKKPAVAAIGTDGPGVAQAVVAPKDPVQAAVEAICTREGLPLPGAGQEEVPAPPADAVPVGECLPTVVPSCNGSGHKAGSNQDGT